MNALFLRPSWRLWLPLAAALLSVLAALWYVLHQPWMGLSPHLYSQGDQPAVVVLGQNQTLQVFNGMVLEAQDLIEDPGTIVSDADVQRFYARQQVLYASLQKGIVNLQVQDTQGRLSLVAQPVQSQRPLHTLPLSFWLQCAVGLGCMLIGGWVWAVLPLNGNARLFALSGFCVLLFSVSAACYSTREMALPAAEFARLAFINRFGATAYGFVGIAFFLRYPLPLVRLRWLWLLLLGQVLVHILVTVGVLAQFVSQALTGLQMLAMLLLMMLQAWFCRKYPVERAALIWLGLSVALGAGSFIALQVLPAMLGQDPWASQALSFVFFMLPYIGIALGLTRYRLFDVGDWAFRLLFLIVGVLLLLLLDVALIWLLNWSDAAALGVALVVVGFVYLPVRDWLQGKILRRAELPRSELFARAMGVAFATDTAQRQAHWQDLLDKLFKPLHIAPAPALAGAGVSIGEAGVTMDLPAVADLAAVRLTQAYEGRGLFAPQHAQLAEHLIDLLRQAHTSHQSYERGVQAERLRVAQDLHDDIGARLLTAIHRADEHLYPLLQETLNDVRSIAQGLAETGTSLEVLLPQLRHETANRCEAAGVQLDWPPEQTAILLSALPCAEGGGVLDYRERRVLVSVLREGVSNALKHAHASQVAVRYSFLPQTHMLRLDIYDDGKGFDAERLQGNGMGIDSLKTRVQRIGGRIAWLGAQEYGVAVGGLLRLELAVRALHTADGKERDAAE